MLWTLSLKCYTFLCRCAKYFNIAQSNVPWCIEVRGWGAVLTWRQMTSQTSFPDALLLTWLLNLPNAANRFPQWLWQSYNLLVVANYILAQKLQWFLPLPTWARLCRKNYSKKLPSSAVVIFTTEMLYEKLTATKKMYSMFFATKMLHFVFFQQKNGVLSFSAFFCIPWI